MFRNQYDTDVTVWSPQGRLHQVEYALEAVKQVMAAEGLLQLAAQEEPWKWRNAQYRISLIHCLFYLYFLRVLE
jgi:hypothetical protein